MLSSGLAQSTIPRSAWSIAYVDSQEMKSGSWGPATPATSAIDGNPSTFWHTEWYFTQPGFPHEIRVDLGASYSIAGFRHLPRQDGNSSGRIAQYEFYASTDGATWSSPVAAGTLANTAAETTVSFSPVTGRYVRLRALSTHGTVAFATSLAEFNVLTDNLPPEGAIVSPAADLTVAAGEPVDFAASGSDPENDTPLSYLWTFGSGSGIPDSTAQNPGLLQFTTPGTYTVSLTVTDFRGQIDATPATRTVTVVPAGPPLGVVPRSGWTVTYVDSQELKSGSWGPATPATSAIDGNPATFWHTQWYSVQPGFPHEIQIDLGASYNVAGFRHLPRQDGNSSGRIAQYEFYVSTDGSTWGTPVAAGTLPNAAAETAVYCAVTTGRYVRLRAFSAYGSVGFAASLAELNVLTNNLPPDSTIVTPSTNLTIQSGETVDFAGSGTDPENATPLSYLWTFGSGSGVSNSTAQNPGAVQFDTPGIYTVTFTVSDATGQSDVTPATRTITVVPAGPPLSVVPRSGWTIAYVDSQEMKGGYWGPATPATSAIDGNPSTFWHTEWYSIQPGLPHEIRIDLGAMYTLAGFRHLPRQDGVLNGRIGQYEFYVSSDGANWGSPVAAGVFPNTAAETTVYFAASPGRYVRLRALSASDPYNTVTSLAELNVLTDNVPPESTIVTPATSVTIEAGETVVFAGTGTDPDDNTPLSYRWVFGLDSGVPDSTMQNPGAVQFDVPGTYTVSFTVTDAEGQADATPATVNVTVLYPGPPLSSIPRSGWSVVYVDSQELKSGSWGPATPGTSAIDGDPNSFWHTQWYSTQPGFPHEIQIDLGTVYNIGGFRHLPRQDGRPNGMIAQYEFYVSTNGATWGTPVAAGTFANSTSETTVSFAPIAGRYVRLRAFSAHDSFNVVTSLAELNVLTSNLPPESVILTPAADVTIAAGESVTFAGSGSDPDDDTPFDYLWTFGPGSGIPNSTAQNPGTVQFNTPGSYTVGLAVTDSRGQTDATPATRTVNVISAGPTVIPRTGWSVAFVDSQETGPVSFGGVNGLGSRAIDGNIYTMWHTPRNDTPPPPPHEIRINLGIVHNIAGFRYLPSQDAYQNTRIAEFEFYVSLDGSTWGAPVATGHFPNTQSESEILFTPTSGQYVRLRALSSHNGSPFCAVAELNVLQATTSPNSAPNGTIVAPGSDATIAAGAALEFTGSGSDADGDLLSYRWSFGFGSGLPDVLARDPGFVRFEYPGTYNVTMTVADAKGLVDPTPAVHTITVEGWQQVSKAGWTLHYTDSEELTGGSWGPPTPALKAFDGDPSTFWHTEWVSTVAQLPHELQINLGANHDVGGFTYLPRQDSVNTGKISSYEFYLSSDGIDWGDPVAIGAFNASSAEQQVTFARQSARYVRLRALSEVSGLPATAVAELGVLLAPATTPSVRLITPRSYRLQTASTLVVQADANLLPGQGVRIVLDGAASVDDYTAPYETSFNGLSGDGHVVDVFVISAAGALVGGFGVHDRASQIAVGDYIVALGDSITYGFGDDDATDNVSLDERNATAGFSPVLADYLTVARGRPVAIFNEGIPGERSNQGAARIWTLVQKHPAAQEFLILYGTNDAFAARPSGLGLDPGDAGYAGSYKESMQQIIDVVNAAGMEPSIAKILPVLPLGGTYDLRIQEYNLVVDELAADPLNGITIAPPNFNAYFVSRTATHYIPDWIHPNGLGYRAMAELWADALIP